MISSNNSPLNPNITIVIPIVTPPKPPRIACALLALAVFALPGCTRGPTLAPVTGIVTIGGAPPPGVGNLVFAPIEPAPGSINRPGKASFDLDGNFTASSFGENDGLAPGKYRVSIVCWKEQPSGKNLNGVSYIPSSYRPEDLVVDADGCHVTYDIPTSVITK